MRQKHLSKAPHWVVSGYQLESRLKRMASNAFRTATSNKPGRGPSISSMATNYLRARGVWIDGNELFAALLHVMPKMTHCGYKTGVQNAYNFGDIDRHLTRTRRWFCHVEFAALAPKPFEAAEVKPEVNVELSDIERQWREFRATITLPVHSVESYQERNGTSYHCNVDR